MVLHGKLMNSYELLGQRPPREAPLELLYIKFKRKEQTSLTARVLHGKPMNSYGLLGQRPVREATLELLEEGANFAYRNCFTWKANEFLRITLTEATKGGPP